LIWVFGQQTAEAELVREMGVKCLCPLWAGGIGVAFGTKTKLAHHIPSCGPTGYHGECRPKRESAMTTKSGEREKANRKNNDGTTEENKNQFEWMWMLDLFCSLLLASSSSFLQSLKSCMQYTHTRTQATRGDTDSNTRRLFSPVGVKATTTKQRKCKSPRERFNYA